MNVLTIFKRPEVNPPEAEQAPFDLEARMVDLKRYGKPRLTYSGSGWHCCVEMNTTTAGASFDIRSQFDHATPREAVRECEKRIKETLLQLKGTP